VRVRVAASSINGFDVRAQNGGIKGLVEYRFPIVLGKDFAGTVVEIGPGVLGYKVGDEVFGVVTKPVVADGAWCDYVTQPIAVGIAKRPATVSVTIAGALGVVGATAHQMLDELALSAGQIVLVTGAAGGVGSMAVQLASARGARVIAIAKPADCAYVRDLGATVVVDPADLPEAVRHAAPGGVDAVVHLAGDPQLLATLIAPGGRLSSAIGADPKQLAGLPITVMPMWMVPTPQVLTKLSDDVASGKLRLGIDHTCSLVEAPQALAEFPNSGKRGKIAIVVG
jgi:NADPH:quinone reductase-like Zn-dependent oxidoreductase